MVNNTHSRQRYQILIIYTKDLHSNITTFIFNKLCLISLPLQPNIFCENSLWFLCSHCTQQGYNLKISFELISPKAILLINV